MKQIVAIQGYEASFHDIAAQRFFGNDIQALPCDTFKEAFAALADKKADYTVVAIENSLYGSINEVYDLLLQHRFWICGEVYIRVEHNLIGLSKAGIQHIREVHSHPVALAQCEAFLDSTLAHAKRFEHHDTAGSVADVKEWNDPAKAAIASKEAAQLHGLKVLQANVETNPENYTRFVVLSRTKTNPADANKTSLILKTADKSGALYHALGAFAQENINLTKLQSRPIIGKAWHYIFYVDVEVGSQDEHFIRAIRALENQGCETIVLGSYHAEK